MPHLQKYIQPGLDSAYEYYSRMDDTKAYVVSMCMFPFELLTLLLLINDLIIINLVVNPNVRLTWMQENWGSEDPHYKKAIKTIKKLVSIFFFCC